MSSLDPKKIMNVGIMILGAGIVLPYLGGGPLGKDLVKSLHGLKYNISF